MSSKHKHLYLLKDKREMNKHLLMLFKNKKNQMYQPVTRVTKCFIYGSGQEREKETHVK